MLTTEQQQVKALLTEAITVICRNGLSFKHEFNIEALIGITLDDDDVFLVSIRETVQNAKRGESGVRTLDGSGDTLVLAEVATSVPQTFQQQGQQGQGSVSQGGRGTESGEDVGGRRSLISLNLQHAEQYVQQQAAIEEEENESQNISKMDDEEDDDEDVEPPLIQIVPRTRPLIIGPGGTITERGEQASGEEQGDNYDDDDHDDSQDNDDELTDMNTTQVHVKQEFITGDSPELGEIGDRTAEWNRQVEKHMTTTGDGDMGLTVVSSVVNITPQSTVQLAQSSSGALDAAAIGTIQEGGEVVIEGGQGWHVLQDAVQVLQEAASSVDTAQMAEGEEEGEGGQAELEMELAGMDTGGEPDIVVQTENGEDVYHCNHCTFVSRRKGGCLRHVREKHKQMMFACFACGTEFEKKTDMDRHFLETHKEHDNYICCFCNKVLSSRAGYKHHIASHRGFNHVCTDCGRGFQHESQYNYHMKHHMGYKKQCPWCGKVFSFQSHTARHLSLCKKRPVKPELYPCPVCGKKFKLRSYVKEHMWQHEDKRRFKCDHCNKTFRSRGAHQSHVARRSCFDFI